MFKDSLGFSFFFSSYHLSSQCYRNSLLLSRPIQIQWLARTLESWKELFVSLLACYFYVLLCQIKIAPRPNPHIADLLLKIIVWLNSKNVSVQFASTLLFKLNRSSCQTDRKLLVNFAIMHCCCLRIASSQLWSFSWGFCSHLASEAHKPSVMVRPPASIPITTAHVSGGLTITQSRKRLATCRRQYTLYDIIKGSYKSRHGTYLQLYLIRWVSLSRCILLTSFCA